MTARTNVLVVEDDPSNRALLVRMLESRGLTVRGVADGEAALEAIAANPPDIVMLDVGLPGIDGFEVCHRIKNTPATRLIPVVLVTGLHDRQHRIEGINAGADDFLSKPVDVEELQARVRSLIRLKRYTDDLESAESVILSLALTVEARDPYTDGHCQRLAAYSTALGRAMALPEPDLGALHRGGYLHDVGKIGIPDSVLLKTGPLAPDEVEIMRRHTIIGERLCGELRSLSPVRLIVRHHHEWLDGSGYPDRLRGDAVPLLAQIVSIADTYDAITTTRPYRKARPADEAYQELLADVQHGRRRADLVEAFVDLGVRGELQAVARANPA